MLSILGTFVAKFVVGNFQNSPNLVTLHLLYQIYYDQLYKIFTVNINFV